MTPEPETTLTMPVVPDEDTETLQAVTEPAPDPEPEAIATVTFAQWHHYPIGDALISSLPGFDIPPCGHCQAVFDGAGPEVLAVVRPLGTLRHLAYEAGWQYDLSLIWTCPQCEQGEAQAAAEAGVLLAGGSYPDILHDYDLAARATMTASGRYSWDYETWRGKYRPRPEKCVPEPADERQAAA